jgi:hypothetical protein
MILPSVAAAISSSIDADPPPLETESSLLRVPAEPEDAATVDAGLAALGAAVAAGAVLQLQGRFYLPILEQCQNFQLARSKLYCSSEIP